MANMSALYRHRIFQSHEKVDTHELIANELADHHLRWHGQKVDTQLYKFDTQNLSLYSLRYGAEVGIVPDIYRDFSLIHFSLSGAIEVEADNRLQHIGQGRALLSTPQRNIRLRWNEGCEQLIMRIPHALFVQSAQSLGRVGLSRRVLSNPGLELNASASRLWQTQLESFVALEEGYSRNHQALGPWLAHVERGIALFFLLQGESATPYTDSPGVVRTRGGSKRRIDRLYAYAQSHLDVPATLADMASAAALSERQLNTFCHAEFNEAPMAWLRGLRLDAIRAALLADPNQDLTDLAMRHGIFHLSRFAAAYRKRFDELPSETRRNAKNG